MSLTHFLDGFNSIFVMANEHRWIWLSIVGSFSLLVGSFLNVVIYRLPIMLNPEKIRSVEKPFNLSKPDSHCPKCNSKINFWQNIPLLSWIILRGKCHICKVKIPYRYPLVELTALLGSVLISYWQGPTINCLLYIFAYWTTLVASVIYFDHKELK